VQGVDLKPNRNIAINVQRYIVRVTNA
jgi:hypothetical protein